MEERGHELVGNRRAPNAASGTSLRLVHTDARVILASYGRLHVAIIRGPLSADDVHVGERFRRQLADETGGPTGVVCIATQGQPIPSQEVLKSAADASLEHGTAVAAAAMVIGGSGFWASTARSAINSVFVVARKSYPTRFFARTTDALAFVLQNLGEDGVDVEALARQIDRLVDP